MSENNNRRVVIALGGNAISPPDKSSDVAKQFSHTRRSLRGIVQLIKDGYSIAIIHGNGPQVGAALLRVEKSRDVLPDVPLGLLVAETEGSMGYMIEQSLMNLLKFENLDRDVVTLITQVLVDKNDPALKNPTKYIGTNYSKEEADHMMKAEGWEMKSYGSDEVWRRVVGSPEPLSIVNARIIKKLIDDDAILITCGGGGVPSYVDHEGKYEGVDAVIDKDLAGAILAQEICASELIILTNVDAVYLNYGKSNQQILSEISTDKLEEYYDMGHFPPGSMGPKVKAAIKFMRNGGERAIICDLSDVNEAINKRAGTQIVP